MSTVPVVSALTQNGQGARTSGGCVYVCVCMCVRVWWGVDCLCFCLCGGYILCVCVCGGGGCLYVRRLSVCVFLYNMCVLLCRFTVPGTVFVRLYPRNQPLYYCCHDKA